MNKYVTWSVALGLVLGACAADDEQAVEVMGQRAALTGSGSGGTWSASAELQGGIGGLGGGGALQGGTIGGFNGAHELGGGSAGGGGWGRESDDLVAGTGMGGGGFGRQDLVDGLELRDPDGFVVAGELRAESALSALRVHFSPDEQLERAGTYVLAKPESDAALVEFALDAERVARVNAGSELAILVP